MDLDHERLDVYPLALDFLVLASETSEAAIGHSALPRGRIPLRISLRGRRGRSYSTSPKELASARSQTSCGSCSKRADTERQAVIVRIVSMLIELAQSCED